MQPFPSFSRKLISSTSRASRGRPRTASTFSKTQINYHSEDPDMNISNPEIIEQIKLIDS